MASLKPTPEDAFYENLLLGLMKLLSNTPRVANVTLDRRPPCERAHVSTWEQRHNVYLPDDMKRFYLSTDGFTLHWSYQYTPEDLLRVGFFSFPQLSQIALLRESVETFINAAASNTAASNSRSCSPKTTTASTKTHTSASLAANANSATPPPQLQSRSKIFELSNILDVAKVCLIYENSECNVPKIYLLECATSRWHFLADTFTEYHRMAIVHHGLPYWELCFSSCPLPPWTEQLFMLLAPHLLEKTEPRRNRNLIAVPPSAPFNQLDAAIFRTVKAAKPTGPATIAAAAATTAPVAPNAIRSQQHNSSGYRNNGGK